ncbi:MAG: putative hydrolase of the superfamily [Bacteroidota bacterium]|nr:putative hydrolase of the superfamily [Bacteroidota bacterium]
MIRNIIFDLGNVLISFRPSEYLEKNNYPPEVRNVIMRDIFGSQEWLLIDNGNLTPEEAIDRISLRSSLKREEIASVFKKRTDIMFPLESTVRLLPELKKRGFKLYYLSNFPSDIFDEIKYGFPFFRYFDGGLISAEVKHSKPDRRFYQILFEKYGIVAEESLYIDDKESNVVAAESLGMEVIHLTKEELLKEQLSEAIKIRL